MMTIFMKSNISKSRVLLLLFLFSAFNIKANNHSISSGVKLFSDFYQDVTVIKVKPGNTDINTRGRKNATPVIILKVLPYQGKIAQLSWTTSDYSIPGTYFIERLDPAGWVVLKQLPYDTVLVYNDTISSPYCNASAISYQIRFISALDNTTSSTETTLLSDQTSPAEVQNLSVTITQTRSPILTWTPVSGDDILGYRIQRYNGFSYDSITTVPDNLNSYIDQSAMDVCEKSYKYVVSTIDKCGISSDQLLYEDFAVQTIKLDPSQPGQCDKFSDLVWNSYINMPGGLGGYKIYRNDGSATIEIFDTQNTTYVDNFNFKDGKTYTYTVKAYSTDGLYTSSSCQIGWTYKGAILPDTVYITQVSVENDSYISIDYHFSPDNAVSELLLERSDDKGLTYHVIDSLLSPVPQKFHFIDSTADVHSQSYYYRLIAIDNCGFKTPSANNPESIFLQCSASQTQNTINWSAYRSWPNNIEGYKIFRTQDGQTASAELIGSVPPETVTFNDPLTDVDPTKMICYWLETMENPQNPYLQHTVSKSNSCCIIKEPVLFMPNAFRPEGINRLFKPVKDFLYVDVQSFEMTIFNRWGQQLFETTDIYYGWDGKINGQAAPASQYSYIVTYKSFAGQDYTKRGTVFLVR